MTKFRTVDPAEYFPDAEDQAALLADAFETGDAGYIAHALGIIARAKGMTAVAKEAGIAREALYKSLSQQGDPKLSTLIGVARALGIKVTAEVAPRVNATAKKPAAKKAKRKAA